MSASSNQNNISILIYMYTYHVYHKISLSLSRVFPKHHLLISNRLQRTTSVPRQVSVSKCSNRRSAPKARRCWPLCWMTRNTTPRRSAWKGTSSWDGLGMGQKRSKLNAGIFDDGLVYMLSIILFFIIHVLGPILSHRDMSPGCLKVDMRWYKYRFVNYIFRGSTIGGIHWRFFDLEWWIFTGFLWRGEPTKLEIHRLTHLERFFSHGLWV